MKRLKYILTITSASFTLVILLNALLIEQSVFAGSLSTIAILQIFVTCLLVAIATVLLDSISFVHDYLFLGTYIVMLVVVFLMELIFQRQFHFMSILVEIFFLTIVFIGVWLTLQCVHGYEANKINKKIKQRRKRNLQ